ncbi:unnamed protein product [Echinostoma caproni]|uniref:Uncharacterized protein n=1 Tax=Echinostoma caproni TaxID=27848 RepID=A0A183A784_9TREM|nr:unnamed protein product [Echinostoma caproni]
MDISCAIFKAWDVVQHIFRNNGPIFFHLLGAGKQWSNEAGHDLIMGENGKLHQPDTTRKINRELKRLQVEGELTSAAIQAIRCRSHPRGPAEPASQGTSTLVQSSGRAGPDMSGDTQSGISSGILHTCGTDFGHSRHIESATRVAPAVRSKLENPVGCACSGFTNSRGTVSQSTQLQHEGLLSTELSTLRRRQEALTERIHTLQNQ